MIGSLRALLSDTCSMQSGVLDIEKSGASGELGCTIVLSSVE